LNILELTYAQLADQFARRYGRGAYHAAAVYRAIFKLGSTDLDGLPEFRESPELARQIGRDLLLPADAVIQRQCQGGTTKLLFQLGDGLSIESVVIPMAGHTTLCISSQIGCRMGCTFCETGRMGWQRNLSVAEITGQVYQSLMTEGHAVRNVVFMGMGEPLDNFDNVVQAIRVLSDQRGLNIPLRRITVSSVGHIDGIRRLAGLKWPQLKLAVSLNAPNDAIRQGLMPVNRRFPMDSLRKTLLDYPLHQKGAILFEYVLIKNINDHREHACQLAEYLRPMQAKLNLIAYNPRRRSPYTPPTLQDYERFRQWLLDQGLFVCRRISKGQSIRAACGQLGRRSNGPRGTDTRRRWHLQHGSQFS
jgi:23S rRNA (adenine2503-C2)-methyltransferase